MTWLLGGAMLMLTSVAAASARLLASDLARAVPLAAPPRPATALVQHGCTRVDGVVSAEHCRRLKRHIFALQAVATLPTEEPADLRHIPGTRIRFREAIDCAFAGSRSDILLPTEDPLVAETLRLVLGALHSTLQAGGLRLPLIENSGTGDRSSSAASGATAAAEAAAFEADAGCSDLGVGLELVECACLVSRPGSTHQEIHSDYRRNLPLQQPPRLVAFLYLQDTPTVEHGATIFPPEDVAAHAATTMRRRRVASTARPAASEPPARRARRGAPRCARATWPCTTPRFALWLGQLRPVSSAPSCTWASRERARRRCSRRG